MRHPARPRSGSSPLTRGKPPRPPRPANPFVAHPRSRGENCSGARRRRLRGGSSPLTRGKRGFAGRADEPPGLIPAHAGKTSPRPRVHDLRQAHPRSRGENQGEPGGPLAALGSSPLTRGKLACTIARARAIGLIPAHAGKTPCADRHRPYRRAHPRSRGENRISVAVTDSGLGSSPLTRGKRLREQPE